MKLQNLNIKGSLLIIKGKILQMPVRKLFKGLLLEDINLAIERFKKGDLQSVMNSLSVIVAKIHTRQKNDPCAVVAPLLADIHHLQQVILSKQATFPQGSTGPRGPKGATGATGPSGPAGFITLPFATSLSENSVPLFSLTNTGIEGSRELPIVDLEYRLSLIRVLP